MHTNGENASNVHTKKEKWLDTIKLVDGHFFFCEFTPLESVNKVHPPYFVSVLVLGS